MTHDQEQISESAKNIIANGKRIAAIEELLRGSIEGLSTKSIADINQRIADLEELMRGNIAGGMSNGSMLHVMARMVETIYGPKENPGGLVKDVADGKKLMAMVMGGFTVLNALIVVFGPMIGKVIAGH